MSIKIYEIISNSNRHCHISLSKERAGILVLFLGKSMAKQLISIQANSGINKRLLKQNDYYKIPQNASSLAFKVSLHGKKHQNVVSFVPILLVSFQFMKTLMLQIHKSFVSRKIKSKG